jgi:hypothetical protein
MARMNCDGLISEIVFAPTSSKTSAKLVLVARLAGTRRSIWSGLIGVGSGA